MRGSTDVAQQRHEAQAVDPDGLKDKFNASFSTALSIGLSPRWVHYSGVSATAAQLAEILADYAPMNAPGDQRVRLDREQLAYHCGISRADKLTPFLAELESIGFLTIYSGIDPTTGKRRQRRNQQGHPIPDEFSISMEPPEGYVGPKNLIAASLDFAEDRDAAYESAKASGKRVRAGNITITRSKKGHIEKAQVSTDTRFRGQVEGADPGIRGQVEKAQVSTDTRFRGQVEGADPGIRGQVEKAQVSTDTRFRGHLQIDQRSSISSEGREIEEMEPVPGGAAKPPATGKEEPAKEVRQVLRELPWKAWAEKYNPEFRLLTKEATELVQVICSAMVTRGIALDDVKTIARQALSTAESNPTRYLKNAFTTKLDQRLDELEVEPLSENPLPLLPRVGKGAKASKARVEQVVEPVIENSESTAACSTCRALEGDGPAPRQVMGPDGSSPCPDCRPEAAAARAAARAARAN
ncbi:hypothetical protein D5S17_23200 [Pseudonocardiaceae bacterium YIM PH 21723]|nr:hypothetical protein D5S17_23200 [Pseudonocardiaceae bacterium YIM PH 21723]